MKPSILKFALAALLALFFMNQGAWAACNVSGLSSQSINPGDVNVPSNAPVGTTLWAATVSFGTASINCNGGSSVTGTHVTSKAASGTPHVYLAVNQPEKVFLGLKMVEIDSGSYVENTNTTWFTSARDFVGSRPVRYQVSLVLLSRPADVEESFSALGQAFTFSFNGSPYSLTFESFGTKSKGNVCNISTTNVSVDLGKHQQSEFSGVGTGTAQTQSFTIDLKGCPTKNVSYMIEPNTAVWPGASNSVVTLDATSKAKGIGVQLLDAGGNPHPLLSPVLLGQSGSYSILLKARYFQTAAPVTGGSANTSMTFTISYE